MRYLHTCYANRVFAIRNLGNYNKGVGRDVPPRNALRGRKSRICYEYDLRTNRPFRHWPRP